MKKIHGVGKWTFEFVSRFGVDQIPTKKMEYDAYLIANILYYSLLTG